MADSSHDDRDALVKRIAELEAERTFGQHARNISAVVNVCKYLIRYGAIVWVVYYIYLSVVALAGQTTLAALGIHVLGDISISQALAWLLGGAGTLYGLNERRVRKSTVAKLQPRIIELERGYDPGRSTSSLTLRGDTNPDDLE